MKNDGKINRSVRRTRANLRDALLELMKTKPIARISSKEVYDTADISRTTFYVHYKDPFDILDQLEAETMAALEGFLYQFADSARYGPRKVAAMFDTFLRFVAGNSNSIQALLGENGDIRFQTELFQKIIDYSRQILQDISPNPSEIDIHEGYSIFYVYGVIGLIRFWLKKGMHIPIPALSQMLVRLTLGA
jgi:AcrR family transcriptional regulator